MHNYVDNYTLPLIFHFNIFFSDLRGYFQKKVKLSELKNRDGSTSIALLSTRGLLNRIIFLML